MSKRLTTSCAILAVLATACATRPQPVIDYGAGARFVPQVVDSLDDVGLGSSVAVTSEGAVYVSYLGFPAVLEPGEIPTQRPIGAAFLPGVLLSEQTSDGLWNRGAVLQDKPENEPNGVTVPFGPKTVAGLDLTRDNTNGTAVAVADNGAIHVAWVQSDGVWYGTTTAGGTSTISQVYAYGVGLSLAGPIGRPAIALDDNGDPWIAFAVNAGSGIEVRVATPAGKGWKVQTVATGTACFDCQPGPTGIANVKGKPVVAFPDPGASRVVVATSDGTNWTTEDIRASKDVGGLSMGVADDVASIAYYAGGKVEVASDTGGAWQSTQVATADLGDAATATANFAPTTGVAGSKGSTFVAWQDTSGVHLASGSSGSFSDLDINSAEDGTTPALAVDDAGNAYVSWYDAANTNLMLGVYGDLTGVALANPSPSLQVSTGPPAGACGPNSKVQLDEVAQGIAFKQNCLVAEGGKSFSINFDNQDAGTTHNVAIYTSSTDLANPLFRGDAVVGVKTEKYTVDALDPGTYFFQCDYHPTQMTGTFVVKKA